MCYNLDMKGKFVTFEGCDGVGKSTQLDKIRAYLLEQGIDCVFVREPGGTDVSEKIRQVILDKSNVGMSAITECLLYSAARAQLVAEVIKPALDSGKLVISDRYIDSSLAYQGQARGVGIDQVASLNEVATGGLMPDVTIFLNLTPQDAFKRKGGRDAEDRMELEKDDFHNSVYAGYVEVMRRYPDRVVSVDSSQLIEDVFSDILEVLKSRGII